MTVLFVNACVRGEESRTLSLCRAYLEGVDDVEEVNLPEMGLAPIDAEFVAKRSRLQRQGDFSDPLFDLSKQFASADEVVVGAPYWDLSFPSVLKVYLEHCSVCDLTFAYTDDARCVGACKAERLVYVTTSGGMLEGANFGYDYLCGIARMFGIPRTHLIAAEGMDVVGLDHEREMEKARAAVRELRERTGKA